MLTIKETLITAIKKLQRRHIKSAILDVEILLAFVLNKTKEFLYSHPEYNLTKAQLTKFEKLIARRLKFEPVAYLVGYKEFYGLRFKVNKDVLIPRPLSEEIIDKTLEIIKRDSRLATRDSRPAICDIGTGSGCLIIALAKKLKELKLINEFRLYAVDISAKALKVAKSNAKLHNVDKYIAFIKGDLLKPLTNKSIDLIMANLPYLTEADIRQEISIQSEPPTALLEKNHYQKLFKQTSQLSHQPKIIYENKLGIHKKNQPL